MISRTDAANMVIDLYMEVYNKPLANSFFDENLFECVTRICDTHDIENFPKTHVATFDAVYDFASIGIDNIFHVFG